MAQVDEKLRDVAAAALPKASPREHGRTVTVACNLPNGLVLRAFKPVEVNEAVIGGGSRTKTEYHETGKRHVIRGNAVPRGAPPEGYQFPEIAGGYALTHGVSAELWENWLKANEESDLVANRCVFAVERDAAGEAARAGKVETGLEPLALTQSSTDKRMPRRRPNVTDVTQGARETA